MKTADFDKKFDDDLDLSSARRPNMGIDTAFNHVTLAGANIFSELGFGEEEARQLQEQAQAEIKLHRALRAPA